MIVPGNVRDAYDFVLQNAGRCKETPEGFVREIHKIVLRNIDDAAGSYRTTSVKISNVEYAPPQAVEVPPFMEAFANELRRGPGGKSVVHFAGETHSKLVAIHPFSDGNGRTARLLMNAILIDAGLPPVIIYFQDKERYLDCLNLSNSGDLSPFLMLMTETMDAAIEEIRTRPTEEPKRVIVQEKTWPKISPQVPSERLAHIVRQKAAALPLDRETRYKAWQAGFESFRQEFHSVCAGFNEAFSKDTLFHAKFRTFDILPFEKYETLVRGVPTPRTWFFSVELTSERHSEQFVFFFQLISEPFLRAGRKSKLTKELPPRDVTLVMSRWSDGTHHRFQNQPVRLREISYLDGQFLFLKARGLTYMRSEKQRPNLPKGVFPIQ